MSARDRISCNPFYVLGLPPTASRAEVERAGQKWLAMLDVGIAAASTYETPLGGMPRDADLVRKSTAALRDPDLRVVHEIWATLEPTIESMLDTDPESADPAPWREAPALLGWGST